MQTIKNDRVLAKMSREMAPQSTARVDAGLYLQKGRTGTTSWIFRFMLDGKRREMGLGVYPAVSLLEACTLAADARRLVSRGLDPIDARAAAAAQPRRAWTFDAAAEHYIEAHRTGWKNAKHAWQWSRTIELFASPVIGHKPVAAVTTADVLAVLSPIWTTKTETASRVRNRIELVLDAAAAQGHRDGANPARWRGHLDKLLPRRSKVAPVVHQPALDWQDAPAFWVQLSAMPDTVARALAFTIITAGRTGEALGARWSEIDTEARTWRVPGARMKAGKDHTVPLSDVALRVIEGQRGLHDDLVFPGRRGDGDRRPLSNMAMAMRLRKMRPGVTVHGFRSTFRDWAAESTAHPNHVVEMALAHAIGGAVESAYRRGDLLEKRRALMADWAAFLTG